MLHTNISTLNKILIYDSTSCIIRMAAQSCENTCHKINSLLVIVMYEPVMSFSNSHVRAGHVFLILSE